MSHALLLAVALAAQSPAAPAPAAAPAAPEVRVDDAAVSDAVEELFAQAKDVVRVAVPPVVDDDAARGVALEKALLRALVDRRREDVVSPAFLRAKLRAQGEAATREISAEELAPFACDHVVLARVATEGDAAVLQLRLVNSERGDVVATASAPIGAAGAHASSARGVRAAVERIADELAYAIEASGQEARLHRTAVGTFTADDAAKDGRLDRYLESELLRALKRRGLLVVERARLEAALEQQGIGQLLEESQAPRVGMALGAQSIVLGNVTSAGAVFSVTARAIASDSGAILGAASAELPRDDVVSLAAVETRTPLEAAVRSAVAPGWGQAYNQQGAKAVVFAVAGYTGLATTAGLGVGGVLAHARYNDVAFFEKLPPEERASAVLQAKALGDTLYVAALVAGGATAAIWSFGVVDAVLDAVP